MLARLSLRLAYRLALMLALFGTLPFACVSVLDLEGYQGVTTELCATLERCYGPELYPDCENTIAARIENASAADRQFFLETYANSFCNETCTNARACLDNAPVCNGPGSVCASAEQCCGFFSGGGECQGESCCVSVGSACTSTNECCGGDCVNGTCGGVECVARDQPCSNDDECCGELRCDLVDGDVCDACEPLNGACATDFDCCEGSCDPTTNTCASSCTLEGDECGSADECCDEFCIEVEPGISVCSANQCLPNGVDCDDPEQCCGGVCTNGVCGEPECLGLGDSCANGALPCCSGLSCPETASAVCCAQVDEFCGGDNDCCVGTCVRNRCETDDECIIRGACDDDDECCSESCDDRLNCCNNGNCGHTPCQVGGPLSPDCFSDETPFREQMV
ncbi:MAG: hypothetical protein AAGA56_08230, partial [Myxococcota bacterium]